MKKCQSKEKELENDLAQLNLMIERVINHAINPQDIEPQELIQQVLFNVEKTEELQKELTIVKDSVKIEDYPAIFDVTILDTLVTHSPESLGRPFYFRDCQEALNMLIEKSKVLQQAYKNVTLFANKSQQRANKLEHDSKYEPMSLSTLLSNS